MLAGWGPAILLQFAHPLVAAGVADHSGFVAGRGSRLGRLHGTVGAMLALTFGAPERAARAARGINRIHDRVSGELRTATGPYAAGAHYSAHDPELLTWVHATLVWTLPRAYELCVGPLTPAERDGYAREAAGVAPLLGIPEGALPDSREAVERCVGEMLASGRLAVGADARTLARDLLAPWRPRLLWPLYWPARLVAIGLLPDAVRRMYGYPWRGSHALGLRALGWLLRRGLLPALPSLLRDWPQARGVGAGRVRRGGAR